MGIARLCSARSPTHQSVCGQYAGDHGQATAGGIPILALDMYEHAYHIDFGANATAYIDTFQRNIDWVSTQARYEDAAKVEGPRPLVQREVHERRPLGVESDRRPAQAVHVGQIRKIRPVGPRGSVSSLTSRAFGRPAGAVAKSRIIGGRPRRDWRPGQGWIRSEGGRSSSTSGSRGSPRSGGRRPARRRPRKGV
jgi:iron/manganese superoxide dismutase-like protein